MLNNYLRKSICPTIMLLGAVISQPFYVISVHVVNARFNETNKFGTYGVAQKDAAAKNSYRAFFYI